MKLLGGVISEIIIDEHGQNEYLRRLSDPYFFQAFGCVLGFDWHSSGLTTTVCGALKEALNSSNLGVQVAGGKGKTSLKTMQELENAELSTKTVEKLKYASRISAKVDSALVQDGYKLYHHSFIYSDDGSWAVVQQGLSDETQYARRYHWLSDNIKSFVEEPHSAICCDFREQKVLDMTSQESLDSQRISLDLVKDNPKHLRRFTSQSALTDFYCPSAKFTMRAGHAIVKMDERNLQSLQRAYEFQPESYEELVSLRGIGAKTIRSLALISELVYGAKPSWKDPVKYSFAHGGKDGIPYPVDRQVIDCSTGILHDAIQNARIGDRERIDAIRRLNHYLKY
jgi:hypothetical protein